MTLLHGQQHCSAGLEDKCAYTRVACACDYPDFYVSLLFTPEESTSAIGKGGQMIMKYHGIDGVNGS